MDRQIKILLTIPNFNTAGSGKVLYDLAKGLDKNKFLVEIACGSDQGEFFKLVEDLELPIHIFETKTCYRPYLTLMTRVLQISKFYKKNDFDIVHSWQWSSDWTEALAAKLVGVKWIYTKKAMGFKSKHWKIKSYLADYIITINDEMSAYFPYKKQQRTINLGLDTLYYKQDQFKSRTKNAFNIIVVANLVRVKGIEILIEALAYIKDDIYLNIVGEGSDEYLFYLKKLVDDMNLENNVKFVGKVLDVRPYLASSNLFVIPTLDQGRREGLPMALVEAMSMEIAVLGSDVSGIRYVLKDFPHLLFEPSDAKQLASKIMEIISMSPVERRDLGIQLRDYCMQNFSISEFIDKHQSLYAELLGKNTLHQDV